MCATSALAILAKYMMGYKSIQKKAKEQSAAALQAKNMHAKVAATEHAPVVEAWWLIEKYGVHQL